MRLLDPSSVTLPVKRILSKPHIGRSPSSNLHTNVSLGHSPVAGRSLLKVQRSGHKPLYESNHHIRVSPVTLNKPLYFKQTHTHICNCTFSGHVVLLSVPKAKPDLNTTLPVRQTASIFKQPVTKVTNHPNNKVKTDPQKAVDQPRQVRQGGEMPLLTVFSEMLICGLPCCDLQLFWERKLSGLNAFDIAEELMKSMDLPKGLQGGWPWA